jgi:hypothetical protein
MVTLPTLDRLQASIPQDLDVHKVTAEWFNLFAEFTRSPSPESIVSLFIPDAFWRDLLALTWNFRTFSGVPNIERFVADRLVGSSELKIQEIKLDERSVELQTPYPDLAWIQGAFTFATPVGQCSGIFRLVPITTNADTWKAHTVFTNLESLVSFPEKLGPLRNHLPSHGKWQEARERERTFADGTHQPRVIIVGAGQSGLCLAARLKCLDVSTLVVERNERVGDNWRKRYNALCLHDPVCEWAPFFFTFCVNW